MEPIAFAVACLLALSAIPAMASTPVEKVACTDLPPSRWMSEQQARTVFKVSKGRSHGFYAVERDGTVVEAYRTR